MITLAITTYNRSDIVIDAFISVLNNDFINEIVIVDDSSQESFFEELNTKINQLENKKIKIYKNEYNLKPFLNKLEAIKKSTNDWIILLDSDNKITDEYIQIIKNLERDKDILYLPEILLNFDNSIISDFHSLKDVVLNKKNIKEFLENNLITTILNVGNFFVNKNNYINTFENCNFDENLQTNDAIYFSFLWITNNLNIKIVDNLKYYHRQHNGSWYSNNKIECENNTTNIINKIKNF
jgi:hypothetical protein